MITRWLQIVILQGWWLSSFFLLSCGTVDLRPPLIVEHGISDAKIEKARRIIGETLTEQDPRDQWLKFSKWDVIGVDRWNVSALRYLTPVQDDVQRFQLVMNLASDTAVYTFLEGEKAGDVIGMDQNDIYRVTQGDRYDTGGWKARLYFEPLYRAFLWPHQLTRMPVLVYGGQGELNENFYYKIYAALTSDFSDSKQNQYILWVNQVTRRVDLVEYTLRNVLKSYQGTVHYSDYQDIGGVFVPSRLQFGGNPHGAITHEVQIESQSLK